MKAHTLNSKALLETYEGPDLWYLFFYNGHSLLVKSDCRDKLRFLEFTYNFPWAHWCTNLKGKSRWLDTSLWAHLLGRHWNSSWNWLEIWCLLWAYHLASLKCVEIVKLKIRPSEIGSIPRVVKYLELLKSSWEIIFEDIFWALVKTPLESSWRSIWRGL